MSEYKLKRRHFLKLAGYTGVLAASTLGCKREQKQPNILFIMSDDHTSQAIGCYNLRLSQFAPTRNIDRLREEGALLKNCFCTNSICVPSRASILTGQYSHLNGAKTLNGRLGPETDTVAKRLQKAGYETAVIGKWHLKEQPTGFDHYNVLRGQGRYFNPILYKTGDDWQSGGQEYKGFSTDVIADLALDWLKKKESSKPFCLMCHFKAVHEPFQSHERYNSLYKDIEIPEPKDLYWPESPKNKCFEGWPLEILTERYLTSPDRYPKPPLKLNTQDPQIRRKKTYQKFIKDYLRSVAGIDDNVGRLLDYLENSGLSNDTVIVYTADQGYFLGEHNLFDKRFMLEESLRMPFIIKYPQEIKAGTTVNDIILNIDFAELLLDYAGDQVPSHMQGKSFRSNLQGKTPHNWRDAMYYHYWTHQERRPSHYGIRTLKFKLIYYYGLIRMGEKSEKCWEFYDLTRDPHEHVNQINNPEYANIIAQLKKRLEELRKQYKDTENPLEI